MGILKGYQKVGRVLQHGCFVGVINSVLPYIVGAKNWCWGIQAQQPHFLPAQPQPLAQQAHFENVLRDDQVQEFGKILQAAVDQKFLSDRKREEVINHVLSDEQIAALNAQQENLKLVLREVLQQLKIQNIENIINL
jgi:hypothetical protein